MSAWYGRLPTGQCGTQHYSQPVTEERHNLSVIHTGDPLHSQAACTQPCNVNTHSRAHCSPGARLCEQWGHGCVNNGARLCASARLFRGSPVDARGLEYMKHWNPWRGHGCILFDHIIYSQYLFCREDSQTTSGDHPVTPNRPRRNGCFWG